MPDGTPYPMVECRIYQAFRVGKGVHVDDEVMWRRDGSSFPAEYRSYPMNHDGELVGSVLADWDQYERVAVFGSGGMSHFVINEDFDHALISAIQARDADFLRGISPKLMKDGTSELLNWVSASGCLFPTSLSGELIDYVPCYRSEAGTGTAQGFLAWT